MTCENHCSGSTVINFSDTQNIGLTKCCIEPWEDFVANLINLGIITVDFSTTTQLQEINITPLMPVEDSILTIGSFIVPLCQLVSLRFTVDLTSITDNDILAGLSTPVNIEGDCETCEASIRLKLDELQILGNPLGIDTLGIGQFANILNLTIVGTGQGIVVAKPPSIGILQIYYAISLCKIAKLAI